MGCKMSRRASVYNGHTEMVWSTVWRGAPHGQPVGRSGRKRAVYEPIKAWPVMKRISVEKTARSEPLEP
jgi:hypothetical protein